MTRPGRGEGRSGPPPRPQAPALGRGDLHGGRRPGPQAASFLRAATGARPSYGSPLGYPEARARPGWRAMYTPAPRRAGRSGTASAMLPAAGTRRALAHRRSEVPGGEQGYREPCVGVRGPLRRRQHRNLGREGSSRRRQSRREGGKAGVGGTLK